MQLGTQQKQKDYPTLSFFQIPFHDPWVRGNLLRELYAYNHEGSDSSTMRFNFKDSPVLSPCLFEQEQSQAQLCH
jgi:hypothetical protein